MSRSGIATLAVLAGVGPRGPLLQAKQESRGPARRDGYDREQQRLAEEKRARKARRRAWLEHGVTL